MFCVKPRFDQKALAAVAAAGAFNIVSPDDRPHRGRVRYGKTQRDHATGSWKQRLDNRAARAAAQND